MVTQELIVKGSIVLNYFLKVIVIDIIKRFILFQSQKRSWANRIMELEPNYITRFEKLTIHILGTTRRSSRGTIMNATKRIHTISVTFRKQRNGIVLVTNGSQLWIRTRNDIRIRRKTTCPRSVRRSK